MSNEDYKSCIDLACEMNQGGEIYDEFLKAMAGPPNDFAAWLNDHGVPEDIAMAVATQQPPELYTTVGQVVCERFW